jgi:hypothetical protein
MHRAALVLFVALASAACTPPPPPLALPPRDGGVPGDGATAMDDANLPVGEPTYYGVVDDILAEHCWGCHSDEAGGIAPFVLDEYASAARHARAISDQTTARTMPPFFAVNDGTCQHFEDHERWLSDAEIATLTLWADRGAPEGDASATPPMRMAAPHIDTPSFTLQMPAPYTAVARGTDPNEIRCFVADPGQTAMSFITGYEVMPGTSSVVHHVIVYEPETDADATMAATLATSAPDGRVGYPCNGGPIVAGHPVALWAPGAHRVDYPATTGLALPPNRALVIQIHYNTSTIVDGTPIPSDQTSIRFLTTPTVAQPAVMTLLSQNTLSLAPRSTNEMSAPRSMTVPADANVWGVFPHMHVTGQHLGLTLDHGGAQTCTLDVERWDFNWQQAYFYTAPLAVSRGDRVTIQCQYDTSTRDAVTTFGEGTENEMCLAFFYATAR